MNPTISDKILVLGIDGMDPRLTRKYIDTGDMPATKELLARGAGREDLVMLGGMPCITPPMWTTLATGCYPNVHGITHYFRCMMPEQGYEWLGYNLDSSFNKAEPLWNVFVEAGKKTLVWHWPGSSWPPTSDSPLLHVIDGTQPAAVNAGIAEVESEFVLNASVKATETAFKAKAAADENIPCVITDLKISKEAEGALAKNDGTLGLSVESGAMLDMPLSDAEGSNVLSEAPFDVVISHIKEANGWEAAPADAKEFTILFGGGLVRRPALILKNEQGVYDHVAVYKSKKDLEPQYILEKGVFKAQLLEETYARDRFIKVSRNARLLYVDEKGESLRIWYSAAMDISEDTLWHPKRLYQTVVDNAGYPPPNSHMGAGSEAFIVDCMGANWDMTMQWNADALLALIKEENYNMVFSQVHNVDAQGHMILKYMKQRDYSRLPEEDYQRFFKEVYKQTDRYIARFLPLLDEGWTIMVVSDHAQVSPENEPHIAGGAGILAELGYAVLKKDAEGNLIKEYDYEKSRAFAQRSNIYINLKGRDPQGIVDPADKYELEEQIMTDLYGYRSPKTGKRMISLAIRNRDAALLGLGGEWPQGGDIIYFTSEGYNVDHGDALSTTYGYADTSVGPIFIAAGKGIKKGCLTNRAIRQVDVVPTLAVLGGVRMPRDCEGAPVYQILEDTF